jgi:hypothetical protein
MNEYGVDAQPTHARTTTATSRFMRARILTLARAVD